MQGLVLPGRAVFTDWTVGHGTILLVRRPAFALKLLYADRAGCRRDNQMIMGRSDSKESDYRFMTPEDRLRQFQAEFGTFQKTPGYILERTIRSVEVVRYTCAENAVELEGSLLAFQEPAMFPLMDQDNRQQLEQFLLLVTRRLYNHLATATSSVEHLRQAFQGMPPALEGCSLKLATELEAFATDKHFLAMMKLRDHSTHHWLHLTTARMTFTAAAEAAGGTPEGWTPQTSILLPLEPVRRAGANRRMRKKGRPAPPDPLQHLPNQIELLPFVKESQNQLHGLALRLTAILTAEYQQHETVTAATRVRLKELWGID